MSRTLHIVLSLDQAVAFDRRAFDGITSLANERRDIRLLRREYGGPLQHGFAKRKIDGVILARIVEPDVLPQLARMDIPFVALTNSPPVSQKNAYVVGMDEAAIGQMAAQHFLEAGYRNFVVVCRSSVREFFGQRIGAFVRAVEDAGFPCDVGPPDLMPPDSAAAGYVDVDELGVWDSELDAFLQRLPKPLAVFTPYDYYAQVAVNAARSVGLRVPDDVAVVGVDDDELYCMTTSPQLCSVITPGRQIGQQGLALLLDVLDGKANVPQRTLVKPPGIMFRGSSTESALADPDVISAVRYIRENAARGISVGQVAQHVLLSRRTLERRFMSTINHTIRDEIRRAKINDAKRLLTDTDLPFVEVARRSGLVQQQQLSRLIKQATGQTPVQFRRSTRTHRSG